MNSKNLKKSYFCIFLCLLTIGGWIVSSIPAVSAQDEVFGRATIHEINTLEFPEVSFFLEGYDQTGQAFSNLIATSISIIENGQPPIPIQTLQLSEPGFQTILAYNLSPAFSTTSNSGISRYQAITDHIITWLNSRPVNTPDDFSLVTDTGLQEIRSHDLSEFIETLQSYQPNLTTSQPSLTSLMQALDLATDSSVNPLTRRAILYITSQPNISNVAAFPGLIERALQQNVPIYVWMVGLASAPSTNPSVVEPLKDLAEKTGGQFFIFSGQEELPDIEEYFRPNRYLYQVTYTSEINQSGAQSISAVIGQEGSSITSEVTSFNLTVEAPTLILINPPLLIHRTWSVDPLDNRKLELGPNQAEIRFMTQFLDGHPREIRSARLLVDGELYAQILQPPFEKFNVDLTPFINDQEISFSIEMEDQLGLSASTQPALIEIQVDPMPLTFWEGLKRLELTPERWIILASIILSGSVLIIAIVLVGKRKAFFREQAAKRKRAIDPLTQPVKIKQADERSKRSGKKPPIPAKKVEALLIPLNAHYEPDRKKTVALDKKEWVIGSDAKQARLVILNSALDDVHARLSYTAQGDYWLRDQNSITGTWVNFTPISTKGVKLRHGDIVHFAKAMYRFEFSHPTEDREIQIFTYNQNNDS